MIKKKWVIWFVKFLSLRMASKGEVLGGALYCESPKRVHVLLGVTVENFLWYSYTLIWCRILKIWTNLATVFAALWLKFITGAINAVVAVMAATAVANTAEATLAAVLASGLPCGQYCSCVGQYCLRCWPVSLTVLANWYHLWCWPVSLQCWPV